MSIVWAIRVIITTEVAIVADPISSAACITCCHQSVLSDNLSMSVGLRLLVGIKH